MPGTILLIDEEAAPETLLAMLASGGFQCIHARGPIKVRELLETRPIDLIIWKEQRRNAALVQDLAREWQRYPSIRVVHLYRRGMARPALPKGVRLHDSLPSDSPQLLPRLAELMQPSLDQPQPAILRGTELAFRNVVSKLAGQFRRTPSRNDIPDASSEFHSFNTALNPTERQLLYHNSGAAPPVARFSFIRTSFGWMTGHLRRIRGGMP